MLFMPHWQHHQLWPSRFLFPLLSFYCPSRFNDSHARSYECPAGHYCLPGTGSKHQYPCPAGTINPHSQMAKPQDCLPCPPGHYLLLVIMGCLQVSRLRMTLERSRLDHGSASNRRPRFGGLLGNPVNVFQVSSVRRLGKPFPRGSVAGGTTAPPGLAHPPRRTEGRQAVHVLKVITAPRGRRCRCPVPRDTTTTKREAGVSPTA